jgi:hypothetical protein
MHPDSVIRRRMDARKWLPELPLFKTPPCTYCGVVGAKRDHTPPRAFLPRKLPMTFNSMTVPACAACNASYAKLEDRTAAIVATVSFTDADKLATVEGGWLHSARRRDRSLARFIDDRIDQDGYFRLDEEAYRVLAAILTNERGGGIGEGAVRCHLGRPALSGVHAASAGKPPVRRHQEQAASSLLRFCP